MALSIKDPETDRLARAVATAAGETLTEAIRESLRLRLNDLQQRGPQRLAYVDRLLAIGRGCAAAMQPPYHSADHGDLLYGPDGLPR
ncbi:MAG: type II toxin-antitoxin system VapB family antitoxin [Rhodospirillaceae bacterium]|nr:type II toxin-antitoxin system VapB family antitoxin [Rhodospirillaceae bacterium]